MEIKSETSSLSDHGQAVTRQAPYHGYSLRDTTLTDSLGGLMSSGPLMKLPAKSRWLFHTCEYADDLDDVIRIGD